MDTRTPEYAKWMSEVWRLNDVRNKEIQAQKEKDYEEVRYLAYRQAKFGMF